jgi:hypothetical protein
VQLKCFVGIVQILNLLLSAVELMAHMWNSDADLDLASLYGRDVSLGGHNMRPSRTTFRVTGDCVYSNSAAMSLRFIVDDVLLLKRYSPLFCLVTDRGDVVLESRMVFLGGLGPIGDTDEVPTCINPCLLGCFFRSISSNSAPKENAGASQPA